MSVKFGPNKEVIEKKTERDGSFGQESGLEAETKPMPSKVGRQPTSDKSPQVKAPQQSSYEARTVVAPSKSANATAQDASVGEADTNLERHTRISRPGAKKSPASERPSEQRAGPDEAVRSPTSDAMDDPPVGWLVVVQGLGQGNVVTIGNGSNSLGRDTSERISLDFGDETISRHGHSTITYDPRGKKFYIQHGGGKNLTYMGDAPVLAPTELEGFSKIQIGETVLLFVPLCGEWFDWAEYAG